MPDTSAILALLERVILDETEDFEVSVQGEPFLPKNDSKESVRVFQRHCGRINRFLGNREHHHLCFMSIPNATPPVAYVLEWGPGHSEADHNVYRIYERLLRRIVPLIDQGYHHRLDSAPGAATPSWVLGHKAVSYYLVLAPDTEGGATGLSQPAICSGIEFLERKGAAQFVRWVDQLSKGRPVYFEAYHVIAGIEPHLHHQLANDPTSKKALELATVQFQREWGNGEITQRKVTEARLHTFDEVLHSALTALRSIQSDVACADFASGNPLSHTNYRLVTPGGDRDSALEPDTDAEERLLQTLQRIRNGERATAAALSLGRLLAHRRLLRNICAEGEFNLKQVMENATQMVRDLDQGLKQPVFECDWTNLAAARIRAGYLHPHLLEILVYELLLNAYNHGKQPITVRISSELRPKTHEVCINVISTAMEDTEWETDGKVQVARRTAGLARKESFLIRFARVADALSNGLSINSSVIHEQSQPWYHAQLWLRPLDTYYGVEKAVPI